MKEGADCFVYSICLFHASLLSVNDVKFNSFTHLTHTGLKRIFQYLLLLEFPRTAVEGGIDFLTFVEHESPTLSKGLQIRDSATNTKVALTFAVVLIDS